MCIIEDIDIKKLTCYLLLFFILTDNYRSSSRLHRKTQWDFSLGPTGSRYMCLSSTSKVSMPYRVERMGDGVGEVSR